MRNRYPTWEKLLSFLSKEFGIQENLVSALFLIGIQISGMGFKKYAQEKKTELIKLAEYTLLSHENFYINAGKDKENWPIWHKNPDVVLPEGEILDTLLRSLILNYFNEPDLIN